MTDIAQLANSLQPGPATELVNSGGNLALLIRGDSREERTECENADEHKRVHTYSSNETELSYGWLERAFATSTVCFINSSCSSRRPAVSCSDWLDLWCHIGPALCLTRLVVRHVPSTRCTTS